MSPGEPALVKSSFASIKDVVQGLLLGTPALVISDFTPLSEIGLTWILDTSWLELTPSLLGDGISLLSLS